MRIHTKLKQSLFLVVAVVLITMTIMTACDETNNLTSSTTLKPETSFIESTKDLEGSWKIVEVIRNGRDITGTMDFSQFRMNFSDDNTYSIENYLPFIVNNTGEWSLDDPQYPFEITFYEENSDEPLVSDFNYPTVDGKRRIILVFTPGCPGNSYEYALEKVSE